MEIKPKYNINDTVYFLAENSVLVGAITEIRICITPGNIQTQYDVKSVLPNAASFRLKADKLFKTKESLVESLFSNI